MHKSDVGGVTLGVKDLDTVAKEFDRLIVIPETYAVEMYPMLDGTDVYIGAIRDDKFGHQIFFGLGGIFIEVLKDVQSARVSTYTGVPLTLPCRMDILAETFWLVTSAFPVLRTTA